MYVVVAEVKSEKEVDRGESSLALCISNNDWLKLGACVLSLSTAVCSNVDLLECQPVVYQRVAKKNIE